MTEEQREFVEAYDAEVASHTEEIPEWDDAGEADYENEKSSPWRDSEPDYRWMDVELPPF